MILDIYYSIGILVLIVMIKNLINFKKVLSVREWYLKFSKITGKKPSKFNFRSQSDFDRLVSQNIFAIFEFCWLLFLVFTKSWWGLPLILFLNLLAGFIIVKTKTNLLNQFFYLIYLSLKNLIYCYVLLKGFNLF